MSPLPPSPRSLSHADSADASLSIRRVLTHSTPVFATSLPLTPTIALMPAWPSAITPLSPPSRALIWSTATRRTLWPSALAFTT